MGQKKIIVILTSGRSGSSLLVKLLENIKFTPGNNLLKVSKIINFIYKGNLKGHFEDKDIIQLNEKIMMSNKKAWFSINKTLSYKSTNKYRPQIKEILKKLLLNNNNLIIKDPRLSATIELWHKELINFTNAKIYYIYLIRNPSEYADSIYKRDKIPEKISEGNWLADNINYLRFLNNKDFYKVTYDELLSNRKSLINNIYDFIFPESKIKNINIDDGFFDKNLVRSHKKRSESLGYNTKFYKNIRNLPSINRNFKLKNIINKSYIAKVSNLEKKQHNLRYLIQILLQYIKIKVRFLYTNHKFF